MFQLCMYVPFINDEMIDDVCRTDHPMAKLLLTYGSLLSESQSDDSELIEGIRVPMQN